MHKRKALVTGGSGFLGSHVADELSRHGYTVTIFDQTESPWLSQGQHMIVGDVMDQELVEAIVKGQDVVYHMAGIADIGESSRSPLKTIEYNILGSTRIIDACVRMGVRRFMFASSLYVYSDKGSFYRVSKQAVESILESYGSQQNLSYTVLRYGSLYGLRAQDWNGMRSFVKSAVEAGQITYYGTGEERREYIHVKDAARLSVQALDEKYSGQCLTVTGTQVMTIREMLGMIREICGKDVGLNFTCVGSEYEESHYSLTPYRYTPKRGSKIVPREFVDLGEGILDLVQEVERECNGDDFETMEAI